MTTAVRKVDESPAGRASRRAAARLDVFIGKWINERQTVPTTDAPSVKILTSEIYKWSANRCFVVGTAYGRIGDTYGGGTEVIRYDEATDGFRTHFFDSKGDIAVETLVERAGVWTWRESAPAARQCSARTGRPCTPATSGQTTASTGARSMDMTLTKIA